MTAEQALPNEEAIFAAAIELADPQERADYLTQACNGNAALMARVEHLVGLHRVEDPFLDGTAIATDVALGPAEGDSIGPYKLLQRLGEGGFGVVFMAERSKPVRQRVALKVIKPGMHSREIIARFEAERQALALMDHPNIAKVFDAGATESGLPYFVMELVHGQSITEYCDACCLPIYQRLELFTQVCRAVQHAHQKGVIHRDLKPTNVMITLHDGEPVAKVIDFGVAKALGEPLTARTLFTRYGTMVGTPQYMSPEQAEMSGLGIDTRSDVYSLGVLLYELLVGQPPITAEAFREAGFGEVRRLVQSVDSPAPSACLSALPAATSDLLAKQRGTLRDKLRDAVRGELDWIVQRALTNNRERRYESASALADDVDRHLNGEPVEAARPSTVYRAKKYLAKRKPQAAVFLSLLLAALIGVAVLAIDRRREADSARRLLLETYRLEMLEAGAAYNENNFDRAIELVAKWNPAESGEDFRDSAWYLLWSQLELSASSKAIDLPATGGTAALSRTGRVGLIGCGDRSLLIDATTGERLSPPAWNAADHQGYVQAISPDGRWLVFSKEPESCRVVDRSTWNAWTLQLGGDPYGAAFSADGSWLAIASSNGLALFRVDEGDTGDWKIDPDPFDTVKLEAAPTALAFAPDSSILYVATKRRFYQVDLSHRTDSGDGPFDPTLTFLGESITPTKYVAVSRDLVAWVHQNVQVYDRQTGKTTQLSLQGSDDARGVCFSPDGKTLMLGNRDGSIVAWDAHSLTPLGKLRGHSGLVGDLDAAPNPSGGWTLLSTNQHFEARVWRLPQALRSRLLRTDANAVASVLSLDGARAAILISPNAELDDNSFRGTIGPAGASVVSWYDDVLYDRVVVMETGGEQMQVASHQLDDLDIHWVALSVPRAIVGLSDHRVLTIDLETGERSFLPDDFRYEPRTKGAGGGQISPDGRFAAVRTSTSSIEIFDAVTPLLLWRVDVGPQRGIHALRFTADGSHLLVGQYEQDSSLQSCGIYSTQSGTIIHEVVTHHRDVITALDYAPDSSVLAIGSFDDTGSLWRVKLGEPASLVAEIEGHAATVRNVHFLRDPSGRAESLVTVGGDYRLKLWDVRGQLRLTLNDVCRDSTASANGRIIGARAVCGMQLIRCATPDEVDRSAWWEGVIEKERAARP
ncbi:MAG: WD40 repeat domain-containing serine/threonine protein kinase [Pirellulaceae bacterium]